MKNLNKHLPILLGIFLFLCLLPSVSSWADNGSLIQYVDGCGTLTTANAVYTLNISVNSSSTCFTINEANITLDGNFYNLTGSNTSSAYGIYSNQFNTTIRNFNIYQFVIGIYFFGATYGHIENSNLSLNYKGVYAYPINKDGSLIYMDSSSNYNTLSNLNFNHTRAEYTTALNLYSASYNNISNLSIKTAGSSSSPYGIYFYSGSGYNNLSFINTTCNYCSGVAFYRYNVHNTFSNLNFTSYNGISLGHESNTHTLISYSTFNVTSGGINIGSNSAVIDNINITTSGTFSYGLDTGNGGVNVTLSNVIINASSLSSNSWSHSSGSNSIMGVSMFNVSMNSNINFVSSYPQGCNVTLNNVNSSNGKPIYIYHDNATSGSYNLSGLKDIEYIFICNVNNSNFFDLEGNGGNKINVAVSSNNSFFNFTNISSLRLRGGSVYSSYNTLFNINISNSSYAEYPLELFNYYYLNVSNIFVNTSLSGSCNFASIYNSNFSNLNCSSVYSLNNERRGISLSGVYNTTFDNIQASSLKGAGLYLTNSNYNNFSNINATGLGYSSSNGRGIYASSSDFNTFKNITAKSTYYGIYLDTGLDNNTFFNVSSTGNSYPGFYAYRYNYFNNFSNMDITSTSGKACELSGSSGYNTFSNINATSISGVGFYVYEWQNNTFNNINASSNSDYAIYLQSATNNTFLNLRGNVPISNSFSSIYALIVDGSNFSFINANSGDSGNGFFLRSSSNVSLTNLILTSNSGIGFKLEYSYYNNISNLTANSNSSSGIYFYSVSHNILSNINGSSNYSSGSSFSSSSNNTFYNLSSYNLLPSTSSVLVLSFSHNNSFSFSTLSSANSSGLYVSSSQNNMLDCNGGTILGKNAINSRGVYSYSNTSNTTIKNCVITNFTNAIYLNGATNSTFYNNTFIPDNAKTNTLVYVNNTSANNLFYWNNFTNTSGYYIYDTNGSNFYNTTVNGVGEGNIYANTLYGVGDIEIEASTVSSLSPSLYIGTLQYNSTLAPSKIFNAIDYAPLTNYQYDMLAPNLSSIIFGNESYFNSTINISVNLSDSASGIKNATINLYNETGFVNSSTSNFASKTLNGIANLVVDVAEGVYSWFIKIFDWAENSMESDNYTLTVDKTIPQIEFDIVNPINNSVVLEEFTIKINLFEEYLSNLTLNWNGTLSNFNVSNGSFTNLSGGNWTFNHTQTGLIAGETYFYNLTVFDSAGNQNYSETRFITGNSVPTFVSVSTNPLNADFNNVDPNSNISILVNISDVNNNLDTAILQWKNSTGSFGENNITLSNISVKGVFTQLNTTFTLPSYEGNISYRLWANDSLGEFNVSNNYTLSSYWDCGWTINSDLGETAGWNQNKNLGFIIINNTGDAEFADNNCSLEFRLNHNLPEGRIYFDSSYLKPSNTYTLSAKDYLNISVNATFLSEIKQESLLITTTEVYNRSFNYSQNTAATLITNQVGPYLYQKITDYPLTADLTLGNIFNLTSYLRNLMGDAVINESNTAYNVTFNWTLPSGLTNNTGNLVVNYSNLTDNNLNENPVGIQFSDLASMSSGIQTVYLYSQGHDLNGDLISNANGNELLVDAVNITFLCSSISDGIYVISCGSLDGDYVAPVVEVQTASSGGGGGGSSKSESSLFAETKSKFELLIGKEKSFSLLIENTYPYDKKNINISVKGINSEYISVEPNYINRIKSGSKEKVEVKITAPAYFTKGNYLLTFTIEGNLDLNKTTKFVEKKYVRLYMVDVSNEEAEGYIFYATKMLSDMKDESFITKDVQEYYDSLSKFYDEVDYSKVKEDYNNLEEIYLAAVNSKKLLIELNENIADAEVKGIDVFETKKLVYLAETIFNRGNYLLSLKNLQEAKLSYALEVKGEINILYEIKNHPLEFFASLLGIFLLSFVSTSLIRARNLKKKYNSLTKEEKVLLDLMKVIQRDTFEKGKMSMEEYGEAMLQYEKKLNNVISEKIRTQSKLVHFLSLKNKRNALIGEKQELRKLIEETQRKYMEEGSLDTRIYQNMLKTYASRLAKVEEELISLEVKSFFRKKKISNPEFSSKKQKENKSLKANIKKEKRVFIREIKNAKKIRNQMKEKVKKNVKYNKKQVKRIIKR